MISKALYLKDNTTVTGFNVSEPKVKAGYCPPRTDWKGLLGACAPACSDDSSCPRQQKCCHHGCGVRCVDALGR